MSAGACLLIKTLNSRFSSCKCSEEQNSVLCSPFVDYCWYFNILAWNYIQNVPAVKVTTLRFNSRADFKSKSHVHMGPSHNGSGVLRF